MMRSMPETGNRSYQLVERPPTTDEYHLICQAVGWEPFINFDAAVDALPASLHSVVALDGEEVVGMGRIVGDGAIYFYIQDVAVLPEHRGRRLGRTIVECLLDWVRANAPDQAFVGLFAAAGPRRSIGFWGSRRTQS
jgi:ribosomal protein S18 acetylase RimI-like enzyme